jgi:glutamyl-tRNA reductase
MSFAIAHDDSATRGLTSNELVWRTCLRHIAFAIDESGLETAGTRLADREAYVLLLEVLCGLKSPIVGETEVLGQFKAFLSSVDREHDWLHALGRRLLTDAREVRATHLLRLGSRTYGTAVRRRLTGAGHVALIGTGALGRELLPFFRGPERTVDIWGRRAACPWPDVPASSYRRVDEAARCADPRSAAIVVAAPVSAAVISGVAGHYAALHVAIDLRGEPDREPIRDIARVITLDDVFGDMRRASDRAAAQVALARDDIRRRSAAFADRMDLRPFGWDDLCA